LTEQQTPSIDIHPNHWATTTDSFRRIIERDKVVIQKGVGTPERA
jgi:hypothetical protein